MADIVDPHSHHLADALPKLKGLGRYAETYGENFRRIEAVSEINGSYKVLDLTELDVVNAVKTANSAKDLYEGPHATDYIV